MLLSATQYVAAKLVPKFVEPFPISCKLSAVVYELADERGEVVSKAHV